MNKYDKLEYLIEVLNIGSIKVIGELKQKPVLWIERNKKEIKIELSSDEDIESIVDKIIEYFLLDLRRMKLERIIEKVR